MCGEQFFHVAPRSSTGRELVDAAAAKALRHVVDESERPAPMHKAVNASFGVEVCRTISGAEGVSTPCHMITPMPNKNGAAQTDRASL